MNILIAFCFFVFFAGLAGGILRKKLYKKILSLSVSLNALVLLYYFLASDTSFDSIFLAVFVIGQLGLTSALLVCHKAKAA